MSEYVSVCCSTESPEAAETFIEEYALDATDRLLDLDACESFMFAPSPNPRTFDRSAVNLMLEGDAEVLLDHERGRWEALVEDGLATDVEVRGVMDAASMEERLGEDGAALKSSVNRLSVRMAKLAYEEFDDFGRFPSAIETFEQEQSQSGPIGWWLVLHHITVQLNYSLEEELDAFTYGIEHTIRNVAEFEGQEAAEDRIDELVATLESKREELKDGRLNS